MTRMQVLPGRLELSRESERVLIDCLRSTEAGATNEDCLTSHPAQADSLRAVLDMRAQLLTLRTATPSPATFASGREALLAQVVHPLTSSHPASTGGEGGRLRSQPWRPASRAAFAGALVFAMASCAIGVSATPAGERVSEVLPDIPTIDVPDQRPPYPFPEYNVAPQDSLPTAEPESTDPVDTVPQPEPGDSQDGEATDTGEPPAGPTKPSNPGDNWLPPTNANETDPPDDVETPDPTSVPTDNADAPGSDDGLADADDLPSTDDGASSDRGSHDEDEDAAEGSSQHGEISAESSS